MSNWTMTDTGRLGGDSPGLKQMACMVPMAPLTRPASTHRFAVSITRAPLAMQMMGSSPPASSGEALVALAPVWMALMSLHN